MKFSEMKETARDWLAAQKDWLSMMTTPESINRHTDMVEGFIDALRLLEIYSAGQAKEAYKELHTAHDEAIKKAALSAANTESGKENTSIFSIAMMPGDVKSGRTEFYRLISSMQASRVSDALIVCTLLNLLRPQKGDCK
ncbi:MAG TPA: hypothetical protein DG942_06295 [Ruminococcaceae bacterium]|jgi:hypothetical protein|nr:hypothetical protein [Oscillospiraceae bacterium]